MHMASISASPSRPCAEMHHHSKLAESDVHSPCLRSHHRQPAAEAVAHVDRSTYGTRTNHIAAHSHAVVMADAVRIIECAAAHAFKLSIAKTV